MADIKRKYNVSAKGTLSIDDERLFISVEDVGDVPLHTLLEDFDGREVSIKVDYAEDYTASDAGEIEE